METNIIYNEDCLIGMNRIPDKSIDCIICDLPYGITNNIWDSPVNLDQLWRQYKRIIKDNGAIILFGNQPYTSKLVLSNERWFRYTLVWEKNKFSDFLNANRKPMKIHEDICVFYKKQPIYNPQYTIGIPYTSWNKQNAVDRQTNYGKHKANIVKNDGRRLPTTVLKFNRKERPIHPTQKPVDLIEWLIKTYTNENAIVLDNCMGVGSTAIACINTNRNYIGYELNEEFYNKCINRIKEHYCNI